MPLGYWLVFIMSIMMIIFAGSSFAQSLTLQALPGWHVYQHGDETGYRYGPSIIINPDNSIHYPGSDLNCL
jgi:hypothetical protein